MGSESEPKEESLGKSTNGPDATDVETMMRAIEQAHSGEVQLTVAPAGIGPGGGLAVVLHFSQPAVGGLQSGEGVLVIAQWPCPVHRDWWACIFEGLYRLDGAIGRQYHQETLPEA